MYTHGLDYDVLTSKVKLGTGESTPRKSVFKKFLAIICMPERHSLLLNGN